MNSTDLPDRPQTALENLTLAPTSMISSRCTALRRRLVHNGVCRPIIGSSPFGRYEDTGVYGRAELHHGRVAPSSSYRTPVPYGDDRAGRGAGRGCGNSLLLRR